jgi:hypothetical protein
MDLHRITDSVLWEWYSTNDGENIKYDSITTDNGVIQGILVESGEYVEAMRHESWYNTPNDINHKISRGVIIITNTDTMGIRKHLMRHEL